MRLGGQRPVQRRRRRVVCDRTAHPLNYWRRYPADAFDASLRAAIAETLARIGSILPEWEAAIAGDAAAAAGIVLRMKPPFTISARTDLAMTLLLNCAFDSAGAALVLSYALRRVRLRRDIRSRLADSWVAHHAGLANAAPRRRVTLRRGICKTGS